MTSRIEGGKLYMGNLISQNAFSFLWSSDNSAGVEFGFGIRKLSFSLKEQSVEYKLELGFRDIRYIHLRNAKGVKLLLVQKMGAAPSQTTQAEMPLFQWPSLLAPVKSSRLATTPVAIITVAASTSSLSA
ncbi:hypothetical protein SUGI_0175080 [Cryptomeria japonica]|nr:hypothetical protein SUGI_0175080 [Cryptomeria japonica]